MEVDPLVEGPAITLGQLQRSFGPCVGIVMGYGEGEFGEDGRLQWCASLLPGQAITRFLNIRRLEQKAIGQDDKRPFLVALGSLKRAKDRGGVPEALFGVGLAAPEGDLAENLLHEKHLTRPENLHAGRFRWPVGVPLLRVWLSCPPISFSTIIGSQHRRFGSSDGNRVVPLDVLVPGLSAAALEVVFQEAVVDRPKPLSPYLAKLERKWREGVLRLQTSNEPVRSRAIVDAALAANRDKYGNYRCEECAYEPIFDPKVRSGAERGMLDVHHLKNISSGDRETALGDVIVLCPLCHRREHMGSASAHPTRIYEASAEPEEHLGFNLRKAVV